MFSAWSQASQKAQTELLPNNVPQNEGVMQQTGPPKHHTLHGKELFKI